MQANVAINRYVTSDFNATPVLALSARGLLAYDDL